MMWKPSVNAIWLRAASRLDARRSIVMGTVSAPPRVRRGAAPARLGAWRASPVGSSSGSDEPVAPPSSSRTDDARPGGGAEHRVSGVKRAPDDDRSLGDHAPMTAAAHPRAQHDSPSAPHTADVLVIFGITGDLAKVMTFLSLYRLERRGLLDCPIVGGAVQDWTVDQLRDHARECVVATGEPVDDEVWERFAGR